MANGYGPHQPAVLYDMVAGLAGLTSYNITDLAPTLGAISAGMTIIYFTARFIYFIYQVWKGHPPKD